ncbi:MAG: hypothetical protein IKL53_03125 [Lachnospiraceae bacterium]|nr:hypothetical protein [Lachnospiraceae bacterium]
MVTKGIIKITGNPNNTPKVNIIKYGQLEGSPGAEDPNLYPTGAICSLPGISPCYRDGDIVYVCIEDNNLHEPVIMGLVGGIRPDREINSNSKVRSIEVTVNAKLPADTTIGNISMKNLSNLAGLANNAQEQLNTINSNQINILEELTNIFNEAAKD